LDGEVGDRGGDDEEEGEGENGVPRLRLGEVDFQGDEVTPGSVAVWKFGNPLVEGHLARNAGLSFDGEPRWRKLGLVCRHNDFGKL
jgi:hypothetical protein